MIKIKDIKNIIRKIKIKKIFIGKIDKDFEIIKELFKIKK